jgi:hypothetical protein
MMTLSWNIGLWKKFGGWGCHGNRNSYLVILQPTRMSWQFIFNNNFCNDLVLLAHLTQRVMWDIAITWGLLSVTFYICIFFSETTGPIGTKLSRNVHWMVLYKVYDFLLIRSTQKKQEAQRCLKGCIHINEYISEKNNSGSVKSTFIHPKQMVSIWYLELHLIYIFCV